jgi:3-deoxy-D-manno-octulosonic-acid transferase
MLSALQRRKNLTRALVDLLSERDRASDMGRRAKVVFDQQAGATDRCVEALRELLLPTAAQERPA